MGNPVLNSMLLNFMSFYIAKGLIVRTLSGGQASRIGGVDSL